MHPTRTDKAPERSGQADAEHVLLTQLDARSYGDPAQERWRPGGAVLAITGQGSQAYLSLPSGCPGVSYSKQGIGPHHSLGFREDQRDGSESGVSRGNGHPASGWRKGASGDGVSNPTDVEAWGRWMAPRGL